MVIDDEEFCLTMMKSILFRVGIDVEHRVDFCITGLEALNQIKESTALGVKYQVVFTDFNMPIMSGIEATKQIREYLDQQGVNRESQPKILGVTGHVGDQYKTEGIKAGMDEIYSKPLYASKMEEITIKYKLC